MTVAIMEILDTALLLRVITGDRRCLVELLLVPLQLKSELVFGHVGEVLV